MVETRLFHLRVSVGLRAGAYQATSETDPFPLNPPTLAGGVRVGDKGEFSVESRIYVIRNL
jgi:hypothetical protein